MRVFCNSVYYWLVEYIRSYSLIIKRQFEVQGLNPCENINLQNQKNLSKRS